jgi:hypothetical protein
MNVKTLGQIAFEALVTSYGESVDAKEWPMMSKETHDAWEAAAQAVKRAVLPSSPFSERRTAENDSLMKARDAVVEAAKEWVAKRCIRCPAPCECDDELLSVLGEAVEALEELEL